jgi:hypothetical protein
VCSLFGVEGQHLGLQCLGNVWGGGSTSGATVFGVEGQHLGLQCLGNIWGGGSTSP